MKRQPILQLGLLALGILFLAARASINRVLASLGEPPPYRISGPGVSIIVPALEEQKYLPKLLASIANQTYEPIETIICDQSDSVGKRLTKEIASRYGATVVDLEERNLSAARNTGVQYARYDTVAIVDADMILSHPWIEKASGAIDLGYGTAIGKKTIYDSMVASMGYLLYSFMIQPTMTYGAVAVNKAAFQDIGGYDIALPFGLGEDVDFGLRMSRRFGVSRMALLDILAGTSGRRWKAKGFSSTPWDEVVIRKQLAGEQVRLLLP